MSTELIKIESDKVVLAIKDAPLKLQENTTSRDNALRYGSALLQEAEQGITPELDLRLAAFIDKAKKSCKAMNEKRSPFTQIMDNLKKNFTSCENDVKDIIDEIQKIRDTYATQLSKEQEEAELKRLLELVKQEELINIQTSIKNEINQAFEKLLSSRKEMIFDFLNKRTLENIDTTEDRLNKTNILFNPVDLTTLVISLPKSKYFTSEELESIEAEIKSDQSRFVRLRNSYKDSLELSIKDTILKIPSKKAELLEANKLQKEAEQKRIEIEAARGEEKERLEKEKAEKDAELAKLTQEKAGREKLEAEKLAQEEAARIEVAKREEEAKSEANKVNSVLNTSFMALSVDVKRSMEIIVKNPAGYGLLFSFWMSADGKNFNKDKIEKMTIGRMKAFCEKHTNTTGETIESPFIEYKEVVKAK